jgi:hypothetical protein
MSEYVNGRTHKNKETNMNIRLSRKMWLSAGITVALVALALLVNTAMAQEPDDTSESSPSGGSYAETMTYQGYLEDGGMPANGVYDFRVTVWDAANAGNQLGSTQVFDTVGITVEDGIFTIYTAPGAVNQVYTGGGRWIQLEVRPHGIGGYTTLPRQPITNVPYAWSLRPGAVISGTPTAWTDGWVVKVNMGGAYPVSHAILGTTATGSAVAGQSPGGRGVYGYTENGYGVYGYDGGTIQAKGYGGYFYSLNGVGVYGYSSAQSTANNAHAPGVYGRSNYGAGVYGLNVNSSPWAAGVTGESTNGPGIRGFSENNDGVRGTSNDNNSYGGRFGNNDDGTALYATGNGTARWDATVRANNTQTSGGMTAYMTNNSDYHTAHFYNSSTGGVLYLQNGGTNADGANGGDFITAVNESEGDRQFRVLTSGEVRSDVGFSTPAADFAEMLPAVDGLEPGDVLVIGPDGKLDRSAQPSQACVVGVYSTQPGFVGGQPVEGELEGHVPLAVVGVVPVKVSAENGPIVPGDLLVTSSTPGHAMKAGAELTVGTIIGKVLEPLEEGTGIIKMLVILQ